MEDFEAYDVIDDIEVIGDDILNDKDIDIECDVFIDEDGVKDNVQEFGISAIARVLHLLTLRNLFHVFFYLSIKRSYSYIISSF